MKDNNVMIPLKEAKKWIKNNVQIGAFDVAGQFYKEMNEKFNPDKKDSEKSSTITPQQAFQEECGVDASKLIPFGDMNYIVQADIFKDDEGIEHIEYDQYQPRKNRVWHGYDDISKEELLKNLADTKERMKMAMNLIDKFLNGEITFLYYWDETSLKNTEV